jgi:hypothetical protein
LDNFSELSTLDFEGAEKVIDFLCRPDCSSSSDQRRKNAGVREREKLLSLVSAQSNSVEVSI